jgi:hydroxyacylglutathione hydrolase
MNRAVELSISPLPAFSDNYLWLLNRGRRAVVVDPGDAEPVLKALASRQLQLDAILVTHHHGDHVGGVEKLRSHSGATVYGPRSERIEGVDVAVAEGDRVTVLDTDFTVIEVPGHTAGHIAYFSDALDPPVLFCGDTLFGCGCGRLFEERRRRCWSLDRLASLPGATRVLRSWYTPANIRFALAVEPGNSSCSERAHRRQAARTRRTDLPSTIGLELQTIHSCAAIPMQFATLRSPTGALRRPLPDRVFATLRVEERLPLIRRDLLLRRAFPRLGRCMNAHLILCAGRALLASALLLSPLAALAGDSDLFPGFTAVASAGPRRAAARCDCP